MKRQESRATSPRVPIGATVKIARVVGGTAAEQKKLIGKRGRVVRRGKRMLVVLVNGREVVVDAIEEVL